MKTITAQRRHTGKRVDRVITDVFPRVPVNAVFKAFRKKDIKVNSVRVKEDYIVNEGDLIDIYIVDAILLGTPATDNGALNKGFSIVYEDENLLVANKEQGIPVHPDREQASGTLIDAVKDYLAAKGEYRKGAAFAPSLCHRLDRNTGGLVMVAKNPNALNVILEKMRNNEIRKYYQCLVSGRMDKPQAELAAYLEKDEGKSRVFVNDNKTDGSLKIITKYKELSYEDGISRLEIELVTGRTHQIRAHLAHEGHPVIGDGKYGTNSVNRSTDYRYQALWAYKIFFDFRKPGSLDYLKGKTIEVTPDFKKKRQAKAP